MMTDVPAYKMLTAAALSGVCSTLLIYPLDVIKYNMQVAGELKVPRLRMTTAAFAEYIVRRDGIRGLYNGISASILKQILFNGARMGLFNIISEMDAEASCRTIEKIDLRRQFLMGLYSGAIGTILAMPADLATVRMAVDNGFREEFRRNYKHVFDALKRILMEEGFFALYLGFIPSLTRTLILNTSQVVSYYQTKKFLVQCGVIGNDMRSQFLCNFISAWVSAVCILPPDMAKIRLQSVIRIGNQPKNQKVYDNMLDVWRKMITNEGYSSLWVGFTPFFLRNAMGFFITFTTYEYLINFFQKQHQHTTPDK